MEFISQGEPYSVTANSELFISATNVYMVRLLNKATRQYISCTAAHEVSAEDPTIGILQAQFTAEQTKNLPVGIYSLEFVYRDLNNNVFKIDFTERLICVRMSSESHDLQKAADDNVVISRNQAIVSDATNMPFMNMARAKGWITDHQSDRTYMTYAEAEMVDVLGDISSYNNIENLDVLQFFSLQEIEANTFENFTKLKSIIIPQGVDYIDDYAFKNCKQLSSISLPKGMYRIGKKVFDDTLYYKDTANWQNGVLYIDTYLIKATNDINYSYTIKQGTTVIADDAFYGNSALESISIPDSVIGIGKYAFATTENLYDITIPSSVRYLGENAFGRSEILSAVLPDGISILPNGVFSGCRSLYQCSIPTSVTTIGSDAFKGCGFTTIIIPENVTRIGNNAFDSNDELILVTCKAPTPPTLGTNAFANCDKLSSLCVPNATNLSDYSENPDYTQYFTNIYKSIRDIS